MGSLWAWVSDEKNQTTLKLIGGALAAVVLSVWTLVTYVWPARHEPTPPAASVQAGACGVAGGGAVSGVSINCSNVAAPPAGKP